MFIPSLCIYIYQRIKSICWFVYLLVYTYHIETSVWIWTRWKRKCSMCLCKKTFQICRSLQTSKGKNWHSNEIILYCRCGLYKKYTIFSFWTMHYILFSFAFASLSLIWYLHFLFRFHFLFSTTTTTTTKKLLNNGDDWMVVFGGGFGDGGFSTYVIQWERVF